LTKEEAGRFYEDEEYFDSIYVKRSWMASFVQGTQIKGRLDLIDSYVGAKKGSLLEVGCAHGFVLQEARLRGYTIAGIEFSKIMASFASQMLGIEVHHGELGKAGFPKGTFDIVCFFEVLEHVPDPGLFIKTVYEILKPGGLIVFACPYFESLPVKLFHRLYFAMKPAEHIWWFRIKDLKRLFEEENGFKILRIERNPFSRVDFRRFEGVVVAARKQ
jgi:2-polyprenyl-3-methyl-5-hydroxy-6-metoxy-1,4-benzoquinol methylase